ncbi:hypothetical protein [Bacillus sp. AK128]
MRKALKGTVLYKSLVTLFFLVIVMSGCVQKISLPKDMEYVLITHLKSPSISIYSLDEKEIIETMNVDFTVKAIGKQDSDQAIFTKENENGIYSLNFLDGTIKEITSEIGIGITNILDTSETDYIFLADTKENKVYFFDKKKQIISDEITVGSSPMSMTINPAKNHLYVSNLDSATISVIDIKEKRVVESFPVIDRPSGVFFDGNRLWVGGHGPYGELNKSIYLYDVETGKEENQIEVGLMPIELYSVTKSNVYVICHGSNEVYQIDTQEQQVKAIIDVSQNPYHIISDEKNLYVTSIDGNHLSIINLDNFTLDRQIALQDGPYLMLRR